MGAPFIERFLLDEWDSTNPNRVKSSSLSWKESHVQAEWS